MKAITESFVGYGILVNQAKVCLEKSGLAGQLLKIKDQYECLVKLTCIENMKSMKYTIKKAVQAIPQLDSGEDTCNINQYIKKRIQNNDISEIIYMEKQHILSAVYQCFKILSPHLLLYSRKKLFHVEKTVGHGQKFLRPKMCDIT